MWFSWSESSTSICEWCAKSALLRENGSRKPAWRALTRLSLG
jgi:hypothetical protein